MKKLLVGTAAIALGLAVAPAAHAQLQLGVAGHFKGYVTWDQQDTQTGPGTVVAPVGGATGGGSKERHFDIVRDTEIHFTGETTLDNGLTVGVHVEAMADAGDSFAVDETYAYMSGYWGRTNVGDEDGAAYLLQVAAPSADSNVDGIRQYVSPVNFQLTDLAGVYSNLDYANDATRHDDKLTYLSPVFSGFQVGASYTPSVQTDDATFPGGLNSKYVGKTSNTFGNGVKLSSPQYGSAYEGAVRWEGTYNNVGLNVGGGYIHVKGENGLDNLNQWNGGIDANFAAFGVGGVYTKDAGGNFSGQNGHTYDAGVDYTTGPFKLGASWLHNKVQNAAVDGTNGFGTAVNGTTGVAAGTTGDVKTNRYSAGAVYTFAPGMSFRGSVGYLRSEVEDAPDVTATYGLLGTQINF